MRHDLAKHQCPHAHTHLDCLFFTDAWRESEGRHIMIVRVRGITLVNKECMVTVVGGYS